MQKEHKTYDEVLRMPYHQYFVRLWYEKTKGEIQRNMSKISLNKHK